MLVQSGIVRETDIKGVFDSNRNFQGRKAYGHTVRPPEELAALEEKPVLIASQGAFHDIHGQMRKMGLKNPIINIFE